MTQEEEGRKYASLMLKVYKWLTDFQNNHQDFIFKFAVHSKGRVQYLFQRENKKNKFYVDLARKKIHVNMSLVFEVDLQNTKIKKVCFDVGWDKSKDDHAYRKFAIDVLKRKSPGQLLISKANKEDDMMRELLSWIEQNFIALKKALKGEQISPEEFNQMKNQRLGELCKGGWLERTENGSYVVPKTADFSDSEDSENKDDMLEKGKEGEMDKLKKELKEFVYNALKDKENFEAYLYKPDEKLSSKNKCYIAGNSSSTLSIKLNANIILGLYSDGKKTELRDKLDLPIKVEKDGTYGLVGEMKVMVPNSGHDGFVFKMDTGVKLSSLRNPESEDAKIDAMTKIAEETEKVLGVLIEKRAISVCSREEKTAGDSNEQQREQNNMISWLLEMVEASKNVILTGAPGTGKTYTAREVAKVMVGAMVSKDAPEGEKGKAKKAEEERIASVQFHPGYDYSDFVIGMKPVLVSGKGKEVFRQDGKLYTKDDNDPNGKGQEFKGTTSVSYDWKDGVFKQFAARAKKAYDEAADPEQAPKFVFLIDEINRADLSRVFGELFSLLEEEYRYPKNKNGIRLPNGESFVIPENLYIIGTMNDIDRSVESMDFALRRRFAWREVKASETMDAILDAKENGKPKIDPRSASKLKVAMEELNKRISGTQGLECSSKDGKENSKESINIGAFLGSAYELGAAIFAKFAKCNGDFDMLWENHIKIILMEYLRGRRDRDEKLLPALRKVYNDAIQMVVDKDGGSIMFKVICDNGTEIKGKDGVDTLIRFIQYIVENVGRPIEEIVNLGIRRAVKDKSNDKSILLLVPLDDADPDNYATDRPIGGYCVLRKTGNGEKMDHIKEMITRMSLKGYKVVRL